MSSADLGGSVFTIAGNDAPFVRALRNSETTAKAFTRRLAYLEMAGSKTFQALGASVGAFNRVLLMGINRIPMLAGIGAAGLTALGAASTKFASDAVETENKFNILFGQSANQSKDALYSFGKEVGRSKQELLDMAANFKGVTRQFDVSEEVANQMAVQLSKLAVDLGSFNNVADSEAAERLYSGLIGNHEALRRLNVFLSEASIRTELLNMGFKGTFETATDQQKQLARLSIVMRDTAAAQGDATRTAGTFANQMKAMWATLKDAGAELGTAIIPSLQVLLEAFLDMMSVLRGNADGILEWGNAFAVVLRNIMDWVRATANAVMDYDLIWQSLWLSILEGVEPVQEAIGNFFVDAFGRMEWLTANWQTMWQNTLTNMIALTKGFTDDTIYNLKGIYDFIASGGTKYSFKTSGTADAINNLRGLSQGTTGYTTPDRVDIDHSKEREKLEKEYLDRRLRRDRQGRDGRPGSSDRGLGGLGGLGKKAEDKIRVEIVANEQLFRKNLVEAFKKTDEQKILKVNEDQLAEQKKQTEQQAKQHQESLDAWKNNQFGLW